MSIKTSTITDHLKELRTRLLKSVIFLFIAFIFCYIFADKIYSFLLDPYVQAVKDDPIERRMIFTALHETFLTYLKLAFFSSFCLSFPIIIIQIWKFIAPGLYKDEKLALMPFLIATPILFILGGMLVYYLIMPLAIKFFLSFETTATISGLPIQLEAKVNEYLSLVTKLIFAFGLSFQLPVLLTLLGKVGFLNSESLKKRRKYVVVMIFAAAAILTPPLLLLYELSIITVKFVEKK
jgi:sec-independent protein translocase protein TatC